METKPIFKATNVPEGVQVEKEKIPSIELSAPARLFSQAEQLAATENEIKVQKGVISEITARVNEIRHSLGLEGEETDFPSVVSNRKKINKLFQKVKNITLASALSAASLDAQILKPETKDIITKIEVINSVEASYGHLKYDDIESGDLVSIGNSQRLNKVASADYFAMIAAAKKDGLNLFPVSVFRSSKDQESNFYGKMKARGITPEVMSRSVAPPGHSEHHTGNAIDFNSLEPAFENTKEFKWMQTNAHKYNFEISFTQNNPQGVMYEPWHWRWVGDSEAKSSLYLDKPYLVREGSKSYIRDLSGNKNQKTQ